MLVIKRDQTSLVTKRDQTALVTKRDQTALVTKRDQTALVTQILGLGAPEMSSGSIRNSQGAPLTQIIILGVPEILSGSIRCADASSSGGPFHRCGGRVATEARSATPARDAPVKAPFAQRCALSQEHIIA